LVLALGSLAWLVAPRVDRPDPVGILLMVGAGVAWGGYTLVGKGADDPVASNARSFCLTIPLALGLFAVTPSAGRVSGPGLALAAVSGAVTSGLGYAVWYRALRGLGSAQAALLQLLVPILAALGAVVFLGETLTLRLVLSGVGVLAGVGLALVPQGVLPWSCPSGRKSG
jgi:drug/metabolite transporter (DMT)-like permease